jgi:hypothetical protein
MVDKFMPIIHKYGDQEKIAMVRQLVSEIKKSATIALINEASRRALTATEIEFVSVATASNTTDSDTDSRGEPPIKKYRRLARARTDRRAIDENVGVPMKTSASFDFPNWMCEPEMNNLIVGVSNIQFGE